jgi:hypothetical protein
MVNDVLLAAAAGGLRGFLAERGEAPVNLKTMVLVSVRGGSSWAELEHQRLGHTARQQTTSTGAKVRRLERIRRGDDR